MLEPLKYLIQPVALERDPLTRRVVREVPAEMISVFSAEQAAEAIMKFEQELQEFNSREGGEDAGSGDNGHQYQLRQSELPGERVGSPRQDRLDVRD